MKDIEELECTTVVRWCWNLLGTLSYVLTITLAYHIEGLVFELSRTKAMSSIQFTRPLNQIRELTKNTHVENNRMPYFRPSSIEFGHWTKCNSLQKNTNGTKSFNWSSDETAKAIWSFVSFITVEPLYNGPVLSYFLRATFNECLPVFG